MDRRGTALLRPLALLLAAALVMSACKLYLPDTESSGGTGDTTVAVQQVPHAAAFQVGLVVRSVELERDNGDVHEVDLSDNPPTVELLPFDEVEAPRPETLFTNESLPEGRYQRLTLIIDTEVSFFDSITGESGASLTPAGGGDRLDFESTFTLDGDADEELVLTIDLHAGLREQANGYELGTEHFLTTNRTSGLLDFPALPGCSNNDELGLYFYQGEGQASAELGDGEGPWFSIRPESNRPTLQLPYLPGGTYTVWYTCDADDDVPGEINGIDFEAFENLEIEAERCSRLEFGGGRGEPGTC